MDKIKIIHQIRRLVIAADSFQHCISLIDHMESLALKQEDFLYPPMLAGVAVTYSKNFNQADGLGPLPNFFKNFSDPDLQTAHTKLIEARNKLYAHRDASFHEFKNEKGESSIYPVEVKINDANTAFLFQPRLVDIPPSRMSLIKQMILLQTVRLQADLDSKLDEVVDYQQGYQQGVVYKLGENFP